MSADTLSDLLRTVRLRGALFFHVDGTSPWVAEAPAAKDLIPAVMPGAEHMMEFHGIVSGSCWAAIVGETPIRLEAGDVILFPQGDAHTMSSAPGMRGPRPDFDHLPSPRPAQLPFALSVHDPAATNTNAGRAGQESATLVCGFLGLDARPFNPLLASLPRVLQVPGSTLGAESWVTSFLRTVARESNERRPGGEAVLERMSEMLFVEVLRRYIDALPSTQTGWLAGMRDPGVGRALALMHERPGKAWTLEMLAEEAALSRSSLHERFVHYIEQPPMQYLTRWRMQVAAGLLRDTNRKVIDVSLDVGYESEAAFSRAFKREVGESPGAWRRSKHQARA